MPDDKQMERQKEFFDVWSDKMNMGANSISNFINALFNAESFIYNALGGGTSSGGTSSGVSDLLGDKIADQTVKNNYAKQKFRDTIDKFNSFTLQGFTVGSGVEKYSKQWHDTAKAYNDNLGSVREVAGAFEMSDWEGDELISKDDSTGKYIIDRNNFKAWYGLDEQKSETDRATILALENFYNNAYVPSLGLKEDTTDEDVRYLKYGNYDFLFNGCVNI